MSDDTNIMDEFWRENERAIQDLYISKNEGKAIAKKITEVLETMFFAGPSYYYIIDFSTRRIEYISPSVKEILGLDPGSVTFNDIVACVHVEDLQFIKTAEAFNLKKMQELGTHLAFTTKMSYCFRERTAKGTYELFQLQALIIDVDGKSDRRKILNIHTNINHLTSVNNYQLTISGIEDNEVFMQFDLKNQLELGGSQPSFTPREMDVVKLIAQGLETSEIAARLFLSAHTVQTHRKKIMHKAKARNASKLIHFCLRKGVL